MRNATEADVLDDAVQMPGRHQVRVDRTRDSLLTDFGRATLTDRYLMPGEEFQDLFARVASFYGDDQGHAQRIYDYMSRLWFMPATPVLSNGGTQRGLPISCFLNEATRQPGRHRRTCGTKMSGSRRKAAVSGRTGATCARSGRRLARSARPRASFRSFASWTA